LPAGRSSRVINDRPGAVLSQPALDLPHQLLPLFLVELSRLPIDQLVDFRIAIAVRVIFGAAGVGLIENLVGLIDAVERRAKGEPYNRGA
jgi:hypothetical protein